MLTGQHRIFRVIWLSSNVLLATAFVAMLYCCVREYSVRRYLDGFSDAIVPNTLPSQQKIAAILNWMRAEPSRANTTNPEALAKRDPEMTLTYRQLLNYDQFAHVRLARLPLEGLHLRRLLDSIYPGWDETVDWSLLLERESFFYLVLSAAATLCFLLLRVLLAWYADSRLRIPRFHLRQHAVRAGATFFSAPEIKE